MGVTEEALRLVRREHACGCQRCLMLQDGCTLSLGNVTLAAGTTPKALTVKLYSARPAPEACHTWNARNHPQEFCSDLNVGNNIIVRVANEEGEITQMKTILLPVFRRVLRN